MKSLALISLLFVSVVLLAIGSGPASQASAKHEEGNYRGALELYQMALKEYPDQHWPIKYNMAQCYVALDSNSLARRDYANARSKIDKELNSLAHNNEGVLLVETTAKEMALEQFKEALKNNPENEEARYNYELYIKRYRNNEDPPPPEQEDSEDQNPGVSDPQNQPPPPPKLENGPPEPDNEPDISMDQARSILRGMAGKEKRFIQELKKYPRQKDPRDGSPNW